MNTFQFQHRVTYAECTVGNHIYYARFLDLLEAARGEFFRGTGASLLHWQEQDCIFPVVECRLRYLAPARYDDTLAIDVWLTVAKGVRLNFAYQLKNQNGDAVMEGATFHACTAINGKPKRLPAGLIAAVQPYVQGGA